MKRRDSPVIFKEENVSLENILIKTLKDKILMDRIKELTAVWNDYSYTPSHYIGVYEQIMEEMGQPSIKDTLAINSEGFWKLDYKWEWGELPEVLVLDEIDDDGEWKFEGIKKVNPEEVPNIFPYLSGNFFQSCLQEALKEQERDNRLYQKYGLLPTTPPEEKIFILGVSYLSELCALPFSFFSSLYRKACKGHIRNK